MLAIANAMIFQEVLAPNDVRVTGLQKMLLAEEICENLISEWKKTIDKIDYVPIFKIGYEILLNLSGNPELDRSLF